MPALVSHNCTEATGNDRLKVRWFSEIPRCSVRRFCAIMTNQGWHFGSQYVFPKCQPWLVIIAQKRRTEQRGISENHLTFSDKMLPQAAIRRAFQAFGVFPSQGDREEKKELGTEYVFPKCQPWLVIIAQKRRTEQRGISENHLTFSRKKGLSSFRGFPFSRG
jgi:hypothetical protein